VGLDLVDLLTVIQVKQDHSIKSSHQGIRWKK